MMRDSSNSFARYSSTTSGCSTAETMFLWSDLRVCREVLQSNRKPDVIAEIKKCVSVLSNWATMWLCHNSETSGVLILVASDGTIMLS